MKEGSIRHFINCALHCPETKIARLVNGLLVFLIIFSISVIPLHFLPNLEWIEDELFLFDRIVVIIFSTEYILRIWSAKKGWRYIFSWAGIIDLVAILPFFLAKISIASDISWLSIFQHTEVFLILRILRILKLAKIYETENSTVEVSTLDKHGDFMTVPGEKIERIIQKHSLIFLISLFLPLVFTSIGLTILVFFQAVPIALGFAVLFFFFAAVFFFKSWLDFNYDVIYITNKRIVLQNRELFGSAQNEISYEAITNTLPQNMGILHWIFGFGNIQIETAALEGNFLFENAPDPHGVVHTISKNRQAAINKNIADPAVRADVQKPAMKVI